MINTTTLENGLRIVNEYMPDIESVSINVWVKTGSRNENKANNGISHFLEHMAFKGTKKRTAQQIAEEFDDIGGRVNAFTSTSETAYYTKVLSENVEKAVELLSDIVQNSIFLEEEMEKERDVILQELAMTNDDPSDIISDYFSETAYKNQPFGRSILGPAKNIKKFKRDDILKYVNRQYKSEDIVISFAGKLKNKEAVKTAKKYFNSINHGKNKSPEKAIYTGGYFAKNKKLEQMQLIMGFESCSYLDDHFYESAVLSIVLGGGMSSKLFQEIREKRGLCYRIGASNTASHDTGIFEIYSAISPEKVNEFIKTTVKELKKSTENITDEECKRAIVKLKSNILIGKENSSSRAQRNASNILLKNKVITTEEVIKKIESITPKKLQILMENILNKSNPTIAMLGKLDKNILDYDKIIKEIKN